MHASLFITCLADMFAPETGVAMVKILRDHGVELDFPPEQTCCGQPAFNTGNWDDARAVARQMIDAFDGDGYVVCPSASCTAMVREEYPIIFADVPDILPRARALGERTYEFIEFLGKVLGVTDPDARFDGSLTYHYTCHQRHIGMTTEAETLVRGLKGATYIPLERGDRCCGFGGAFVVKQQDVSGEMVRDKVDCILATGADAVVVNDTGCIMNIAGELHRRGSDVPVIHLARILSGEVTYA
jgi:L-lactate dehydrogenase complex protein LldE